MAKLGESGLRWLIEFFLGKFTGKADKNHTHSDYAAKDHTHSDYLKAHPSITTSSPTSNTSSPSWGGNLTAYSEITKDTNGHVTGGKIVTYALPSSEATTTAKGLMSAADKKTLNAIPSTYATKEDLKSVSSGQDEITAEMVESICNEIWSE